MTRFIARILIPAALAASFASISITIYYKEKSWRLHEEFFAREKIRSEKLMIEMDEKLASDFARIQLKSDELWRKYSRSTK